MNADQIIKHEMYTRTIKLCNDHPDKVALNPAFQEDKEILENLLPNITRLSQIISGGNAHAENKLNIKTNLVSVGLDVCTNLHGYGKKIGDDALMKMSTYTKSTLGKGKEVDFLERCQNIAKKARDLVAELVSTRGMKESLLTNYEGLIQQYKDIKSEPRGAIQEKSALIQELDAEFVKAETAFDLMVGSAVNLKGEADEFLMRFTKAIIIIAPRISSTKINFIVENSETKEKILAYQVESNIVNMTRTPTAARALAMPIAPQKKGAKKEKSAGTDFTITSDGFETAILTGQKIKKGKVNTIKVVLNPIKAA